MRRFLTLGSIVTLLALPSAAVAHSQHAGADGVRATFSYSGAFPRYRDLRLRILRDGRTAYEAPVSSRYCTGDLACGPLDLGRGAVAVHVVQLDAGGQPAIVLGLYTGGAHCCVVGQVYSYDPATGGYVKAERDFYDAGFRLVDLGHDGIDEFQSADDAFAYEFTDYAASGLPVQVLSFTAGRFENVTRSYPRLIAADAATWMRAFRAQAPRYRDTTGLIAAWAADEDELAHSAQVARFLRAQARAGRLNSALYPRLRGRRFIAVLRRFLRRRGYLR